MHEVAQLSPLSNFGKLSSPPKKSSTYKQWCLPTRFAWPKPLAMPHGFCLISYLVLCIFPFWHLTEKESDLSCLAPVTYCQHPKFIHAGMWTRISLLYAAEWSSPARICHVVFIPLMRGGACFSLGCFCVCASMRMCAFRVLGYTLRTEPDFLLIPFLGDFWTPQASMYIQQLLYLKAQKWFP